MRRFAAYLAMVLLAGLYTGSASAMCILDCWHPASHAPSQSSTVSTFSHTPATGMQVCPRRHLPLAKPVVLPAAPSSDMLWPPRPAEAGQLPSGSDRSISATHILNRVAPRPPPVF